MRLILAGIMAMGALVSWALPPPFELDAPYRAAPIRIDGLDGDADWGKAQWATNFVDITGDAAKTPRYSTRVKTLWDDEYFYVFASLEEPHVSATLTNRDDIVWHDNDFEIFIDPDGDGENYFEFEFNATNTVFDLFLTRPYSSPKGNFVMHQWNAEGLRSAVALTKTGWNLEAAIPNKALANGFKLPFAAGRILRVGFSRVEWLSKEKEENWTWGATGKVDMHIPERWGKIRLLPKESLVYAWSSCNLKSDDDERLLKSKFAELRKHGVTGVCVGGLGFDASAHQKAAELAHSAGLEYHAWVTTLLREDAPETWYAVNQLGESACKRENRAYVDYYAVLCPNNPEVVADLCEKCANLAKAKDVDFVQLDYIRYADAILAEGLWRKYGFTAMTNAYPKADYCYCENCKRLAARSELSWDEFRVASLTACVNKICDAVHGEGKGVCVDVFPSPKRYAIRMVRQDWAKWKADKFFAMNYNNFYSRGADWIGEVVKEEADELRGKGELYSGLKIKIKAEKPDAIDPEFSGLSGEELKSAIELSLKGGANGICLFTPEAMDEDDWRTVEATLPLPWEGAFNEELRRNWIDADAVIDEERDDWRPFFRAKFRPLVRGCKTPIEAVQKINSVIWDLLDVHYSVERDKANQSPFHSMRIHKASCTGMAILQICAYRAVGIPARLVGCNWTTIRGNHSWVEFYADGDWHFFGDGDPSPIDESWIAPYAAAADARHPATRIYASRATPNADKTRFWITWAWPQGYSDVWADDVTERYRKFADGKKAQTADAIPEDTNYQKHQNDNLQGGSNESK